MKRVWVACITSMLVAAFPVASTFAEDQTASESPSLTDKLTVNVSESCTLTRATGDTSTSGNASNYTAELVPGSITSFPNGSGGNYQSVFAVTCNYNGAFAVKATLNPLEDPTNAGTPIIYSDTTPVAGSGTWTATVVSQTVDTANNTAHNIAITSSDTTDPNIKYGALMSRSAGNPITNATYTIQYTVAPATGQAAGTYTGTAEYVLSKNS